MKSFNLIFLLSIFSIIVSAQSANTIIIKNDTTTFTTTNSFITYKTNYETLNNNFITGNSYATIRSQDNPRIFVDGMPINPIFINNLHYAEFLGSTHLLSYDLQNASVTALQANNKIANSEGIPILGIIENHSNDITNTNYIMLKQIGLNYQLKEIKKNNYIVGLNYNKMSSLYLPVPSFINTFSMSFKAKF